MFTCCYEFHDIVFQMPAVTVRVWYCHGSSNGRLCIMWDVYFSGLVYLAGKASTSCYRFPMCVLLINTAVCTFLFFRIFFNYIITPK